MKANSTAVILLKNYVFLALFVVSLSRFALFLTGINVDDLQLDFSSLYVAGQTLNHGLNPYLNYLPQVTGLWDGYDPFQSSKFIYPPLAGSLFQVISLLPYTTAKELWSLSILFCVMLSVALQADIIGCKFSRHQWLLVCACIMFFLPLMAELERGQIDALCLFLLSMAMYFQLGPKPRPICSGLFIALASLFKLHCGLIIFYLLLKRNYKSAAGFAGGWIILLLLSVTLYGWQMNVDYLTVEMPRISKYICYGSQSMRLDPLVIAIHTHNIVPGFTPIQGIHYAREALGLNAYAGLPFYVKILLESNLTFGAWALIIALFILCLIFWHELNVNTIARREGNSFSLYLFWQISLIAVLLSGPITWVMNSVWLVPLIPLLFHYFPIVRSRHDAIGCALLAAGLVISGFPDESYGVRGLMVTYTCYLMKPILGEVLCLLGLLRIYHEVRAGKN